MFQTLTSGTEIQRWSLINIAAPKGLWSRRHYSGFPFVAVSFFIFHDDASSTWSRHLKLFSAENTSLLLISLLFFNSFLWTWILCHPFPSAIGTIHMPHWFHFVTRINTFARSVSFTKIYDFSTSEFQGISPKWPTMSKLLSRKQGNLPTFKRSDECRSSLKCLSLRDFLLLKQTIADISMKPKCFWVKTPTYHSGPPQQKPKVLIQELAQNIMLGEKPCGTKRSPSVSTIQIQNTSTCRSWMTTNTFMTN